MEFWIPAIIIYVVGGFNVIPCPDLDQPRSSFRACKQANLGNKELLARFEEYRGHRFVIDAKITCIRPEGMRES